MTALTDFLLARIAEDEEAARGTQHNDGPRTLEWRPGGKRRLSFDNGRGEAYEAVFAGNWDRVLIARDDGRLADHIARWDPARVLAECQAKRRIVERYAYLYEHGDSGDMRWALPLLALPYADHPDHRQEWTP